MGYQRAVFTHFRNPFTHHQVGACHAKLPSRRNSFLVLEHQMSLRGKFVCTSLRWRLSLIYLASLLKFGRPHAIYWNVRLAPFFGPLAHAPSDVGLDQVQGNHWRRMSFPGPGRDPCNAKSMRHISLALPLSLRLLIVKFLLIIFVVNVILQIRNFTQCNPGQFQINLQVVQHDLYRKLGYYYTPCARGL